MNRWEQAVLSRSRTDAERLEAMCEIVPWSGCWIWLSSVSKNGYPYGKFWNRKKKRSTLAHRASWEIYKGEIPNGRHVLHKCDVPCCVNPSHLFLGTHSENILDCSKKGRLHGKKLSDSEVEEIRSLKGRQKDIAKKFGISRCYVSEIKSFKKRAA